MSFDHDAWMHRGAERQDIVAHAIREGYDFVDGQQASMDNPVYILLAFSAIELLLKDEESLEKIKEMTQRVSKRICEEMRGKAKSEYEFEAMVLAFAKSMLESGTSKAISNLGIWESRTFVEGRPHR